MRLEAAERHSDGQVLCHQPKPQLSGRRIGFPDCERSKEKLAALQLGDCSV
jgi:hypothetical protein